jgi:hypothetical protein
MCAGVNVQVAVQTDSCKAIWNLADSTYRVYSLASDPGELVPLYRDDLRGEMEYYCTTPVIPHRQTPIRQEQNRVDHLRDLGYIR